MVLNLKTLPHWSLEDEDKNEPMIGVQLPCGITKVDDNKIICFTLYYANNCLCTMIHDRDNMHQRRTDQEPFIWCPTTSWSTHWNSNPANHKQILILILFYVYVAFRIILGLHYYAHILWVRYRCILFYFILSLCCIYKELTSLPKFFWVLKISLLQ